jgi:hypothetical protein
MPDHCDRCFKPLAEGTHGEGICPYEPRKAHCVVGDLIPGGQIFENGFSTPQRFDSHSEHRRALDKAGLQIAPRYVEGSKHLTRWDTVDLEAARVLVTRGASPRMAGKQVLPPPDDSITVTDAGWKVKS